MLKKMLSCYSVGTTTNILDFTENELLRTAIILLQREGVTYTGRPFLLFGFPAGFVL